MVEKAKFPLGFGSFVVVGDCITADIDGFTVKARIEFDDDTKIDDDDVHNVDQGVTGCNDEQQAKLLEARDKWFADEWFYCGVVLSVSKNGITLVDYAEGSIWGCDCNYPGDERTRNGYLTEYANEGIESALAEARAVLAQLCNC